MVRMSGWTQGSLEGLGPQVTQASVGEGGGHREALSWRFLGEHPAEKTGPERGLTCSRSYSQEWQSWDVS